MERDGVFGQVRAEDREPVALAEAARGEARGGARHQSGQLRVGDDAPAGAVDQRGLVAALARVREDVVGQRDLGDRDIRVNAPKRHAASPLSISRSSGLGRRRMPFKQAPE
jgi:hypothetical protein